MDWPSHAVRPFADGIIQLCCHQQRFVEAASPTKADHHLVNVPVKSTYNYLFFKIPHATILYFWFVRMLLAPLVYGYLNHGLYFSLGHTYKRISICTPLTIILLCTLDSSCRMWTSHFLHTFLFVFHLKLHCIFVSSLFGVSRPTPSIISFRTCINIIFLIIRE